MNRAVPQHDNAYDVDCRWIIEIIHCVADAKIIAAQRNSNLADIGPKLSAAGELRLEGDSLDEATAVTMEI
jgi:hypothetical protein